MPIYRRRKCIYNQLSWPAMYVRPVNNMCLYVYMYVCDDFNKWNIFGRKTTAEYMELSSFTRFNTILFITIAILGVIFHRSELYIIHFIYMTLL